MQNRRTPAGHQTIKFTKKIRRMSLCVGVLTCPKRYGCCVFKPTCLTLLSAYVQTRTCFVPVRLCPEVKSSPLCCLGPREACYAAGPSWSQHAGRQTWLQYWKMKRNAPLPPVPADFFFAAWYKHFWGAQEMKDTCRTTPKGSYCGLRIVVYSLCNCHRKIMLNFSCKLM